MATSPEQLQRIFEAALMVAGRPLTIADLQKLFDESEQPNAKDIRDALEAIQASYQDRGIQLSEVASGFQFQAKNELSPWISRLWEERAPHFSRAFLETIALIAYRQPITRAEIEEIRGVAVSSNIIKTLQEREWIRVIGYRDTPGKPALYGTTKIFLDHLNLKSLDELPTLSELIDLEGQEEKLQVQLELAHTPEELTHHEQEHDHDHTEECSHDEEDEHEHTEECSHDEEHEHDDTCLHDEDDEHEHTEECSHDEEHEHDDTCLHDEDDEHEHTEDCSYDEDDEHEHEHTEACSHDDETIIKHDQEPVNDEDDITSDPYPEETSKA